MLRRQVDEVLTYLNEELGISGEDAANVVKKFPEAMALPLSRIQANQEHLQKPPYYMKKDAAAATMKRRPDVMGYIIDCQGDCQVNEPFAIVGYCGLCNKNHNTIPQASKFPVKQTCAILCRVSAIGVGCDSDGGLLA